MTGIRALSAAPNAESQSLNGLLAFLLRVYLFLCAASYSDTQFYIPSPKQLARLVRAFFGSHFMLTEQAEGALIAASNKLAIGGVGTAGAAKAATISAWLAANAGPITSICGMIGATTAVIFGLASCYFQWRRHVREERMIK